MRRLVALAVTVGMLAVAGCSDLDKTENGIDPDTDGQIITIASADRDDPVDATGPAVDGDDLDLSDYRGKVVVANVWWSGCGPCRQEMPLLVDVVDDVGADAVLLGINVREVGIDNARSYMRTTGVDFPSFYDPGSEVLLEFHSLKPQAIPSTAILDRQGRLAALVTGEIKAPATLRDVIEEVVAEDDS